MWKQRIIQGIWLLAGAGTLVLLVAAMQIKSAHRFNDVQVEISGAEEHVFVDEKDVLQLLKQEGVVTGLSIGQLDLRSIEDKIQKDPWVRNAELFFDNKKVLQVRITEREPVARVFTVAGNSFYLDAMGKVLPLSEKQTARVPVFTGFPFSKKLSAADSPLLKDVIDLSNYIISDSFWNAQIAQVDIDGRQFEMIPVIGNHTIRFGNISAMEKKFKKLFSFYKNVSVRVGFDKYETINLQFEGQIVATKRGATIPGPDSATAMQHLQQSLETMRQLPAEQAARQTVQGAADMRVTPLQQPKALMRSPEY